MSNETCDCFYLDKDVFKTYDDNHIEYDLIKTFKEILLKKKEMASEDWRK
jgi:hypothetical protein